MAPYLAVLSADGDKMGAAISGLKSLDKHKEFSQKLSEFAGKAREIVRKYYGCCVYTGGDDVLAFLPLDKALPCARDLHGAFGSLWEGWNFGSDLKKNPTLSVGLAVGHALEDLEFLLKCGRAAEGAAKNDAAQAEEQKRNGLCVTVRARGNAEMRVHEQWKDKGDEDGDPLAVLSLDQRLTFWAKRFAGGRIPSRFPYEVRGAAKLYENWEAGEILNGAMRADVSRVFRRKDVCFEGNDMKRAAEYIEKVIGGSHESIERLADELLIAQWIGTALETAGEV
jgi:CRISPR-associated protein Cmr2